MKATTELKAGAMVPTYAPWIVVKPNIALNLAIIVQIGRGNSAAIGQAIP
jgi:hypothetical protein